MSTSTKVLWLITGLRVGGAEKLLAASVPYLDRDRFSYELCYLFPRAADLVGDFAGRIPVFAAGQSRRWDARVVGRLAGLLRARHVDVLHAHLPYAGIVGRLAARLAGVRSVVYTEHSVPDRYHLATRIGNRVTYRANAAVIAVSDDIRRTVLREIGSRRAPRIETIPVGVDTSARPAVDRAACRRALGVDADQPMVVNVARFSPPKAHDDLLRAARVVCAKRPETVFVLVGGGPLEAQVRAQASALGLTPHVVFAGVRPDALDIVASADVFVMPSRWEGLPLAMLEAMSLGIPVVASRVGGIPEAIRDGQEGFLVPPGDADGVAARVLDLIDDADLRGRLGAAARRRAADFSVARMVERIEALYDEVVLARGTGRRVA